jgi:hypothetical protein
MTEPPDLPPPASTPSRRRWLGRNRFAILIAIGSFLVIWLFEVLLFNSSNQSGIICITPVAWVLSGLVGARVARDSQSQKRTARLMQASIAGCVFGVLIGLLYTAVVLIVGRNDPANLNFALISGFAMILVGGVVCTLLAFIVAALMVRHLILD